MNRTDYYTSEGGQTFVLYAGNTYDLPLRVVRSFEIAGSEQRIFPEMTLQQRAEEGNVKDVKTSTGRNTKRRTRSKRSRPKELSAN